MWYWQQRSLFMSWLFSVGRRVIWNWPEHVLGAAIGHGADASAGSPGSWCCCRCVSSVCPLCCVLSRHSVAQMHALCLRSASHKWNFRLKKNHKSCIMYKLFPNIYQFWWNIKKIIYSFVWIFERGRSEIKLLETSVVIKLTLLPTQCNYICPLQRSLHSLAKQMRAFRLLLNTFLMFLWKLFKYLNIKTCVNRNWYLSSQSDLQFPVYSYKLKLNEQLRYFVVRKAVVGSN